MNEEKKIEIKVCGMRDPQNLEELCSLEPDYVGFIFYPGSLRYVGARPDKALFKIPRQGTKKVGVFVDEELSEVSRNVEQYALDLVQLHGSESVEYCRQLSMEAIEVIKAIDPGSAAEELERYREVAELFLFDSAGKGRGGSGHKFDWNLLGDLPILSGYLLSGGIGPGDARLLKSLNLTGLRGVDINSRFEVSPGIKDIESLRTFFKELRK